MNNENTIIDPQYNTENTIVENTSVEQAMNAGTKGLGALERAAYAAGGAVIGAGATVASQAVAASVTETTEEPGGKPEAEDAADDTAQQPAPESEDAIVATATGVRVAHVSDDMTFAQAFADARAQVGAGGVFEWHGRVYGTYYKDEWDNMTAEQKHEYQASIDYNDVQHDTTTAQHHNDVAQHHTSPQSSNVHQSSYEDPDTGDDTIGDDVEVQVVQVGQTDLDGNGIPENAAMLDINGQEVLIVDINQDGIADAAFHENNGEIEGADISDEAIAMPPQPDADVIAQADPTPDYMNDADVAMFDA